MGDRQPRRLEVLVASELVAALALLAVAVVDAALLPRPFGYSLNLVLSLAVARLVTGGPSEAARWGFYGGLGLDLTSGTPLGLHPLALLAALSLVYLLTLRLRGDSLPLMLGAVTLAALVYGLALALLQGVLPAPTGIWQQFAIHGLLPAALVVSIPALPICAAMRAVARRRRRALMLPE